MNIWRHEMSPAPSARVPVERSGRVRLIAMSRLAIGLRAKSTAGACEVSTALRVGPGDAPTSFASRGQRFKSPQLHAFDPVNLGYALSKTDPHRAQCHSLVTDTRRHLATAPVTPAVTPRCDFQPGAGGFVSDEQLTPARRARCIRLRGHERVSRRRPSSVSQLSFSSLTWTRTTAACASPRRCQVSEGLSPRIGSQ